MSVAIVLQRSDLENRVKELADAKQWKYFTPYKAAELMRLQAEFLQKLGVIDIKG